VSFLSANHQFKKLRGILIKRDIKGIRGISRELVRLRAYQEIKRIWGKYRGFIIIRGDIYRFVDKE